ncbi:MAG: hypothetical protein CMJ78_19545 [Planctomycetaceae bacterium]|nr:hypothetical protein [Planctomycetaceae bacterium]
MSVKNLQMSLLGLTMLVCVGCGDDGPQRLAAYGKIEWNEQEIPQGSITFLPSDGNEGPSASAPVSSGRYEFTAEDGPVAGENQVIITFIPPKTQAMLKQKASQKDGELDSTAGSIPVYEDPDADEDEDDPAKQTEPAPAEHSSSSRSGNAWKFSVNLSEDSSLRNDFTLE